MKNSIKALATELEGVLHKAYEETPTIEDAEKFAARFLEAQLILANELAVVDLDARMRKAGTKRVKAAIYTDAVAKSEKKPTEAQLAALVDMNELVEGEQTGLDAAEVERELIQNYMNIFREGHVYMRQLSKAGG
jgi:hypothetical protein